MEIKKDKYLKELKKLGLDDLKAKSFLYDLEKDFEIIKTKPIEINKFDIKKINSKLIIYSIMTIVMIGYLVWIFNK